MASIRATSIRAATVLVAAGAAITATVVVGDTSYDLTNAYSCDIPGANADLGRIIDNAALEPTDELTLFVRVKFETAENLKSIFSKTDLSGDNAVQWQTNILREGNVRPAALLDGWGHGSLVGPQEIGKWGSQAAVWDISADVREFYVNGSKQSQYAAGSDPGTWTDTGDDWSIGDYADNAGDRAPDAKFDDVMIFHSRLTPAEIWCLHNNNGSIDPAGCGVSPVAFYRCGDDDSGTGTTVTNIGSLAGAHDMTLEGTAAFSTDEPIKLATVAAPATVSTNDYTRQVVVVLGQSNASGRGAVPSNSPYDNGASMYCMDNNGPLGSPNGSRTIPVDPAAYATTDVCDDRTGQTAVFPASEDSGAARWPRRNDGRGSPRYIHEQRDRHHSLRTWRLRSGGLGHVARPGRRDAAPAVRRVRGSHAGGRDRLGYRRDRRLLGLPGHVRRARYR